jgi:protocatechuate 3,4-dioxygenase alpha subunit
MSLPVTPGQTVGPFFAFGLEYGGDSALVPPGTPGAIRLHGRVLDGAGEPVPDALVELWQTDAAGLVVRASGSLKRDGHTFTGWGRCGTDRTGTYAFTTIAPGAPFFALTVFARGLLDRLFTRAYLPGHPDDRLLASLEPERRTTLVATGDEHGYVFDIRLQGDGETVFLDLAGHSAA